MTTVSVLTALPLLFSQNPNPPAEKPPAQFPLVPATKTVEKKRDVDIAFKKGGKVRGGFSNSEGGREEFQLGGIGLGENKISDNVTLRIEKDYKGVPLRVNGKIANEDKLPTIIVGEEDTVQIEGPDSVNIAVSHLDLKQGKITDYFIELPDGSGIRVARIGKPNAAKADEKLPEKQIEPRK